MIKDSRVSEAVLQKDYDKRITSLDGDMQHQNNIIQDFIQHHQGNGIKNKSIVEKNNKQSLSKTVLDINEEDEETRLFDLSEEEDQQFSVPVREMKVAYLIQMKILIDQIYCVGAFNKMMGREFNKLFTTYHSHVVIQMGSLDLPTSADRVDKKEPD